MLRRVTTVVLLVVLCHIGLSATHKKLELSKLKDLKKLTLGSPSIPSSSLEFKFSYESPTSNHSTTIFTPPSSSKFPSSPPSLLHQFKPILPPTQFKPILPPSIPPSSFHSLPSHFPITPSLSTLADYPVKSSSAFSLSGGGCQAKTKLLKEGEREALGNKECGVLSCRKYGGQYHLEELKCNVIVYNPNYTCVVLSDLSKPFPECCPKFMCDD